MDAWERQQIFREMVTLMLRNGPLSTRRRRQLVQYAAALNINARLAGRLIEQARKNLEDELDDICGLPPLSILDAAGTRPESQLHLWLTASAMVLLAILFWLGMLH